MTADGVRREKGGAFQILWADRRGSVKVPLHSGGKCRSRKARHSGQECRAFRLTIRQIVVRPVELAEGQVESHSERSRGDHRGGSAVTPRRP